MLSFVFADLCGNDFTIDHTYETYKSFQVVVICQGKAFELTAENQGTVVSSREIFELRSDQEETDTRTVLYASYAVKQGYENVRVRSPDSDIFFILLHFAPLLAIRILFDTGTGNKRRLLNITEISGRHSQRFNTSMMALHAYTGCDTTSAFKGIGKQKPIKLLKKMSRFEPAIAKLGESWEVTDAMFQQLEEFTCHLYGQPRLSSIDSARLHLLKKKCDSNGNLDPSRNIDIANLPPCSNTLKQHIRRANYQVGIWKKALDNFPEIPDPSDHGWVVNDGKMEPLWCDGPVLPNQLVDVLESRFVTSNENDDDEDIDYYADADLEYLSDESDLNSDVE